MSYLSSCLNAKMVVVNLIKEIGKISRLEISGLTGIKASSLTGLVAELLNEGIVRECAKNEIPKPEKISKGRRPTLLQINPQIGTIIGVHIDHTSVRSANMDFQGNIKNYIKKEFSLPLSQSEIIAKSLESTKEIMCADSKSQNNQITGIGVGVVGVVSSQEGKVFSFPKVEKWQEVSLKEIFTSELHLPVIVEKATDAAALGEKWLGAIQNINNALYVHLGEGISLGIIIDGKLYRGISGNAGELGHITVVENGPMCYCGNYGCLERLASAEAILSNVLDGLQNGVRPNILDKADGKLENVNMDVVIQALEEEDRFVYNIMQNACKHIGLAVANAVNIFNPEIIIIGGGIIEKSNTCMSFIRDIIKTKTLLSSQKNLKIVGSCLDKKAPLIGAGSLVVDFTLNRLTER